MTTFRVNVGISCGCTRKEVASATATATDPSLGLRLHGESHKAEIEIAELSSLEGCRHRAFHMAAKESSRFLG
jgi:hypothetical protein